MIYTKNGLEAPVREIAGYISPYFKGGFWTGERPRLGTIFALPFTAVIDLSTGEVVVRDTSTDYVMISEVLAAVKRSERAGQGSDR